MFGFGKKMEQPGGLHGVPTDQVISMRQQGMSDNQIIQTLQDQGFQVASVSDAMRQADMNFSGAPSQEGMPPLPGGELGETELGMSSSDPYNQQEQFGPEGMPPPPDQAGYSPQDFAPQQGNQQGQYEQYAQSGQGMVDENMLNEIAEKIVNEKWKDIMGSVHKIGEWQKNMDSKIIKIEENMKNLQNNFDKLHTALLGKIKDYDQDIVNAATEVKAMEKVFQKVLPTFTENVNKLDRIAKSIKKK